MRRLATWIACALAAAGIAPADAQALSNLDAPPSARVETSLDAPQPPSEPAPERAAPALSELDAIDVDALLAEIDPARRAASSREDEATPATPPLRPHALDDLIAAYQRGGPAAAATLLRQRTRASATNLARFARRQLARPPRDTLTALRARTLPLLLSPDGQRSVIAGLVAALAALLALRAARGRGDVDVCIEYPPELRGSFSVHISKRRRRRNTRRRPRRTDAEAARSRPRPNRRFAHHRVARETRFCGVRTGRHWVSIDGFLQAAEGDETITDHFEQQEVRVRRGHGARVAFEVRPFGCPVEVKVVWAHKPATEARVGLRGDASSIRFARGGPVRIGLGPGRHTLVVGSGDRVVEREIEIDSFEPRCIEIDLAGRENVLFAGCPPAVEPYLLGDVPAAARALEHEGQSQLSHLLLARMHRERNQLETAARHYEDAGHPREAAELRLLLEDFGGSAALFERAGEDERAAKSYRSAGELVRAGEAFQRASQFESAVECFREAQDVPRWVEALAKSGARLEAAQVAVGRGDLNRAIGYLQQVPYDDPDFAEAASLLIDLYLRSGHLDLAAQRVEETIRALGAEAVPLETCDTLARRLEEAGDVQRALDLLESIRRRDLSYPDVAARIESLRKRQSAARSEAAPTIVSPRLREQALRYEILEEIGRGGMGVVYRARDRRLDRIVALKRLPENLRQHPNAVKLFLREARAAAALNHPHIVTVHDAGHEGDHYFIAMELLEGSALHDLLRDRGRLTARTTAQLGVQITAGLEYAHARRIVHRDIKTANLFFTDSRKVKIMDFGLAKTLEEVRRASTLIGGTPYYMAPEQGAGDAVDHRADLYALGVTCFELLTGRVPFTEGDVPMHHRHSPPPDPRERADAIPDALAELVLRLLAKRPDDRFASAAEVSARLHEILKAMA